MDIGHVLVDIGFSCYFLMNIGFIVVIIRRGWDFSSLGNNNSSNISCSLSTILAKSITTLSVLMDSGHKLIQVLNSEAILTSSVSNLHLSSILHVVAVASTDLTFSISLLIDLLVRDLVPKFII